MANFKPTKKLQEIVIHYLVTKYADDSKKEVLNNVFHAIDTNHDGIISKDELCAAF